MIILVADLAELKADFNAPAVGQVIEGKMDPKRGNTATLIVTDGTLKRLLRSFWVFLYSSTNYGKSSR